MALSRGDVKLPPLPKRTVACPELGGEVVVRGLLLRDRLALVDQVGDQNMERVAKLLTVCVIDPDGKPLLTTDEWEQFGAVHFKAALDLFGVAADLAGLGTEVAEKN